MLALMLICLTAIAVPFVVYPALIWFRSLSGFEPPPGGAFTPSVDLVICAFNEESVIGEKVRNALALDYPGNRLTIWIASDGSTDATAATAKAAAASAGKSVGGVYALHPARIVVLELPRLGKAAALTRAVQEGHADIVAFSDANSDWEPGALRALVAPLADSSIGAVAGDQRYRKGTGGDAAGERGYWNFERRLKRWQAAAGSTTSATGAIYCIRRSLFEPPPDDATDDFMISTGAIAAGRRLAFAPGAIAWEHPAASADLEFRRKLRVMTRGLRSLYYRRRLLDPRVSGSYAIQLFVHKLLRRLLWIPATILLVSAPFGAAQGGLVSAISIGMLLIAGLVCCALLIPALRRYRLFSLPLYAASVLAASAIATLNAVRGRRITRWHLPRDGQMMSGNPSRSGDSST